MVLCWHHLVKRSQQLLSLACRGRGRREQVLKQVLGRLWHGRDVAIEALEAVRERMKSPERLDELCRYLEARRAFIPDYDARRRAGLWIASTRVEKFNDWSVASRRKRQGMNWTEEGVNAVAAIETARRNGELSHWRRTGALPSWNEALDLQKAA
jgi:hypothetical protein